MHSHRIHSRAILRSVLFERLRWRFAIMAVSFVATIFGLLAPFAQKRFTESLLAHETARPWVFLAFGCLLIYHGLWQFNLWLATREGLFTQKSLGDDAFHRLLEGPGGLIGREPAGVAVSLFAVDIPGAAAILDQSLLMFCSLIFPLILGPVALHSMFGIPWWASIGSLAVLAFVNFLFARRQSRFFMAFKQLAAERTGLVSEWVQNIRTLRILGWVGPAETKIFALRRRETVNRKKMVTNGQIMNAIASSSTFSLNVLAVILLLRLRGTSNPSPGELLALLWILGVFLSRPLRQLPWMLVMTFDALSSVRRLENAFAIQISRPSLSQRGGANSNDLTPHDFALDVTGLNLEYDGKPLLRDIDLRLKKGALVAVVGEVGSGKSLLLHSLIGGTGARFDRFALNGNNSAGPLDPAIRGKIAFVAQEGFTISATLRENILFTYLDGETPGESVDNQARRSLIASQFDPAKERMPHGLDTEIGERGVNLSGGQRQRIGLARCHFADRNVVLLDDCLSAVDVNTERRLIDDLITGEWKHATRLIATHRLSILPLCDEVIFLHDGGIEIRGSYEELLALSPRFREFVRREDRERAAEPSAPVSIPEEDSEGKEGDA